MNNTQKPNGCKHNVPPSQIFRFDGVNLCKDCYRKEKEDLRDDNKIEELKKKLVK